jgi:2-polyprenyl-3-methyl-5-hydroxy-6-metoxy-1,4-benzoquinol methylase
MVHTNLIEIVEQIKNLNPLHGKKLSKNLKKQDESYFLQADKFLSKYNQLLFDIGKDMNYSIDCYLQMIADFNYETVQFLQTGEYSSKSFDEVNERVYNNPEVMEYFMHGLLLSQFLWTHHYDITKYFNEIINQNKSNIKNYLEVGGGHGLYISDAITTIGSDANYDLVDISPSSIDIAKKMINNSKVNYSLIDIFEYFPSQKYDFITMGEVLEHVEDPVSLLAKLHGLLADNGKLFITTPTNAPSIDHIYLFRNADDIRKVINEAGFAIENEFMKYAEDLPAELAEQYKITMMYAGVLIKKK